MLHDFKDGRTLILVATDVAARGLDVKDIRMVINFDFPKEMEVSSPAGARARVRAHARVGVCCVIVRAHPTVSAFCLKTENSRLTYSYCSMVLDVRGHLFWLFRVLCVANMGCFGLPPMDGGSVIVWTLRWQWCQKEEPLRRDEYPECFGGNIQQ